MINYIRPSFWYFDHAFEELGVRNWSRTLTFEYVCLSVVVTFVPASVKTDSFRSQFQLFCAVNVVETRL